MSSRAEQKQRLKEERLKAEQAERAKAARGRRLGILGGVVVVAIAAVVIALVATGGGKDKVESSTQAANLFTGIQQEGLTLGDPNAPVTVEEFLDLQCPICKSFSETGLPTLVDDYVKTGKVKLVMRPIQVISDESKVAADVAIAAADQGKAWDFAETFYANQGPEASGYVTDEFLEDIAKATPGLDAAKALSSRNSDAVQKTWDDTQKRMEDLGVNATPTFYATKKGGEPQKLDVNVGDPSSIATVLDPIVGSAN